MKARVTALLVLCAVCGCNESNSARVAELEKELEESRAALAAARNEAAELKSALEAKSAAIPGSLSDLAKAVVDTNAAAPAEKPVSTEDEILHLGKEFVTDIEMGRVTAAYKSTSRRYQDQTMRTAFEELVKTAGVNKLEIESHWQTKVRKADQDAYEFYCTAHELNARGFGGPQAFSSSSAGVGPRVNFSLTMAREDEKWKVDSVEIVVEN